VVAPGAWQAVQVAPPLVPGLPEKPLRPYRLASAEAVARRTATANSGRYRALRIAGSPGGGCAEGPSIAQGSPRVKPGSLRGPAHCAHGPQERLPVVGDQEWPDARFPAAGRGPALRC